MISTYFYVMKLRNFPYYKTEDFAISFKNYTGLTTCYNFLHYFEGVTSYSSCNLAEPQNQN